MALKARLKKLDGLSDEVKEHYTEKDGEFFLDVTAAGGFALEDVTGLKSALGKQTQRADEAVETLKEFEGLDPKKARDAIQKVADFDKLDPEKDADKIANEKFETLKTQLVEKHAAELAERDTRLASTDQEVDDLTRKASARSAIEKHDGIPKLLMPLVLQRTKPKRRDDGSRSYETLNEDGTPAYASNGDNLSLDALVGQMKEDSELSHAFKGTGHSGSGSETTHGSGNKKSAATTKKASDMSTVEKSAFITEHGNDAWTKKVGEDYAAKPGA